MTSNLISKPFEEWKVGDLIYENIRRRDNTPDYEILSGPDEDGKYKIKVVNFEQDGPREWKLDKSIWGNWEGWLIETPIKQYDPNQGVEEDDI